MKIVNYNRLNQKKKIGLLTRPAIDMTKTYEIVKPILENIKENGLNSVLEYSQKFDGFTRKQIKVNSREIENSENLVTVKYKNSIKKAAANIKKFHKHQIPKKYIIDTMPGI